MDLRTYTVSMPLKGCRSTHCGRGHEFTPANTYNHKTGRRCRECINIGRRTEHRRELKRAWAAANPVSVRNTRLKKYGITLNDYNCMLAEQGNKCGNTGCNATTPGGWQGSWFVDHDHKTGKVRGLLCLKCNRTLGTANDDPVKLQGLIDYLKKE